MIYGQQSASYPAGVKGLTSPSVVFVEFLSFMSTFMGFPWIETTPITSTLNG